MRDDVFGLELLGIVTALVTGAAGLVALAVAVFIFLDGAISRGLGPFATGLVLLALSLLLEYARRGLRILTDIDDGRQLHRLRLQRTGAGKPGGEAPSALEMQE
jgi:hypothetical protein